MNDTVFLCIALALGVGVLASRSIGSDAFSRLVVESSFPTDAVDFMDAAGISGPVLNYYQWGGYMLFRGDGRYQVFIDGRAGTVYGATICRQYLQILQQSPGWIEVVEESGAEYVLWPSTKSTLPASLIATGRWQVRHSDPRAILLARVDPGDGLPGHGER